MTPCDYGFRPIFQLTDKRIWCINEIITDRGKLKVWEYSPSRNNFPATSPTFAVLGVKQFSSCGFGLGYGTASR